jgi:pimeloyl-ACP methyl ester carboxylesterase
MQHLLLLHGAIGANTQLLPLAESLQHDFIIHNLNFAGHGGESIPNEPFSIALFAKQVMRYMDDHIPAAAIVHLFGYSMGGYVGMYINKHWPGRLTKIVTLATKFHWEEAVAVKEVQMLNPDTITRKVPVFADQLAQRHLPADWKIVLQKTADMMLAMGKDNPLQTGDYPAILTSCLLLLGDRDKMVTLEETVAVYKQLPNAQLGVLPGTAHPIEQVNLQQLVFQVRSFLKG